MVKPLLLLLLAAVGHSVFLLFDVACTWFLVHLMAGYFTVLRTALVDVHGVVPHVFEP